MEPRLIVDLDGVVGEFISYPGRTRTDLRILAAARDMLESLHKSDGLQVVALTDKPSGQLTAIAHLCFGDAAGEYQIGESGASAVRIAGYYELVNPIYRDWVDQARQGLKRALVEAGCWHPEPGSKRVCLTVNNRWTDLGAGTGKFFEQRVVCAIKSSSAAPLADYRSGEDGNIVTIIPKVHTKAVGIKWLDRLYSPANDKVTLRETDWSRSAFIADGKSDIAAAMEVVDRGGHVAAVANAHRDLKEFVRANGGFIAANMVENGFLECVAWYRDVVLGKATQPTRPASLA